MDTTLTTSINELTATEAAFAGGFLGSIMVIGLIICVLLIIAGWRIFEKAGEKGWKILIPIYDIYILFKICNLKNWFWVMFCITIIASIMMGANMPQVTYVEDWTGYHIDYAAVEWSEHGLYLAGLVISCVVSIVTEVAIAIRLAKSFG